MSVQFTSVAPLSPASAPSTSPVSTRGGAGSASLSSSTGLSGLGGSMSAAPRLATLPGVTGSLAQPMQGGMLNQGQAMMGTAEAKSGTAMEEGEAKMLISAGKALSNLMGDPVRKA